MARYVVVIKADRGTNTNGDAAPIFLWEVRELLADGTGTVLERSGPTLVTGTAPDAVTARHEAEVWAETLAVEDAYVYNTSTMDPVPLPTPPSP